MLLRIIGGHCKLATMTSRRRPWPGDKLAVAGRPDGNKPVDGSQRARRQLPRARSLFSAPFPFPPATNYGLGEERRCSPDPESRTPRTHSRSRPARSHSRTATYQTKPTIASSGPVVSQSPSLLRERAPKQQPSPPLVPSSPLPSPRAPALSSLTDLFYYSPPLFIPRRRPDAKLLLFLRLPLVPP